MIIAAAHRSGSHLSSPRPRRSRSPLSPSCLPEPLGRSRAGVLLRRHDRGAHRGALEDQGAPGDLADIGHAVQEERQSRSPRSPRQLNVDAVVEGSVQRVQDEVRITAQLVRADPEKHLWADTYTESSREHPRSRERDRPGDRPRDPRSR